MPPHRRALAVAQPLIVALAFVLLGLLLFLPVLGLVFGLLCLGFNTLLLAAVINVMFAENLVSLEPRIAKITNGLDELRAAVADLTPESVEKSTGVSASTIRTLAREISAAPTAAVYGRIGVNAVEFGTLNAWLIDAINMVTGNLDRRGGVRA